MTSQTQEEITYAALRTIMDNHFATGEILKLPEKTLQKYIWSLCSEGICNEKVRHRAIVRALTINHIQMQRHIDGLNKRNTTLQWVVIALAIVSILATGYQIYRDIIARVSFQQPTQQHSMSIESMAPISNISKEALPSHGTSSQATSGTAHQNRSPNSNIPSLLNPRDAAPSDVREHGRPKNSGGQ